MLTDPPGDRGSVAPWLMKAAGNIAASAAARTILPLRPPQLVLDIMQAVMALFLVSQQGLRL